MPAESTAGELPSVFWYKLAVEARRPRGKMLLGARSESPGAATWCLLSYASA